MFLKLRILFTILAALCLVAIVPATMWGGGVWFALLGLGALFFFAMMLLCKQSQEKAEKKEEPKAPDFLHPDEEKKE